MKIQLTYIIVSLFLFAGLFTAQKIDINVMPKAGPVPVVNIGKPKTFQLSNGLTVIVVENNKLPQVTANLSIDRPPYYEGNIVGVEHVVAGQLKNGTANLSKDEFNKKVDFLGADLSFSSEGVSASSLSKFFPEILQLMAEAIIHPKFSDEEIQNTKQLLVNILKSKEKDATFILQKASPALQYGKNTSRGQVMTVESVNRIQTKDVKDSYQKYYTPNHAYLVIVGDIKFDHIKSLVSKTFSGWKKSNIPFVALEPVSNVTKTEINVIDVPTAVQSVIRIQNIHSLKMKDANYFPARTALCILGEGVSSRLDMNLREKNGFTYGSWAVLNMEKYRPLFITGANVRNEVTDKSVREFMNELNLISIVKAEELENAKAKLKGDFIMSLEDPNTLAKLALNQKVQELAPDFYTHYLKSLDKVTVADISRVAKDIILPNQSRIMIVGKVSDIAEGLEKLGYPVKYYDQNADLIKE
ncbi:pitrilysin family protein [Chryseobacterium tructae]|uniref:M16 family metallopeptidase n=1 Tax=Chryseobacterium tructae TaxID=1037380 RepID=A0ABV7XY70_9FLAO|nr:pitrilysin family protein [Chryseobacterium tructae]MDN3692511.1 pitrilysin family protein [Chryseobacterium tructae]